jgi:ribosome biogenesis GTPase
VYRCFKRSNLPSLVCGDRVAFETDGEGGGVVVALEERRSVFARPGPGGRLRPVAANVDQVLIVIAPLPQPRMNLLDRYLVAVETLGLEAVVVINKADLLSESQTADMSTFESQYTALGYSVATVSALEGTGVDQLKTRLKGKSAVIVGQSGVGKSSLLNTLGQRADAQVGSLSEAASKGTHTTTAAALFHLDGFDLIDSPGIREFDLWPMPPERLQAGFVEFRPFLGRCKFRDCSHRNQPGCALADAVNAGQVPARRLESYFHILDSLPDS